MAQRETADYPTDSNFSFSSGRGDDQRISSSGDTLTGVTIPADTDTPNILEVTGQGEVSVPTTLAQVQLGVQVQEETATEVREELAELSTAVLDVLEDLGAQELQTTSIQLNPVYSFANDTQTLTGFQGTNILQFEVPTEQAGEAIDAAIQAGANTVQNINFTASDTALEQARQQALREAVQDAQAEAGVVLDSLGLVAGEIIDIDILAADNISPPPVLFDLSAADAAAGSFAARTPILGGPETVTANVSLDILYSPASAGTFDIAAGF